MWRVERVQVNGGFLSGLNVLFGPGLNVIIGARGAGKTTLLELIRHAAGVAHPDKKKQRASQELVAALLKDGEVIVDFTDGTDERRVVVDARGSGRDESLTEAIIALGQNELEVAASDPESRRNLLDLHADTSKLKAAISLEEIAGLTREAFQLRTRVDTAGERMAALKSLQADHDVLITQRELLAESSSADEARKLQALQQLDQQAATFTEQQRIMRAANDALARVQSGVLSVTLDAQTVSGILSSDREQVQELRQFWDDWVASLSQLVEAQSVFQGAVLARENELATVAADVRLQAAPLRAEVEEAREGLGNITSAINAYVVQMDELRRVQEQADRHAVELSGVLSRRASLFDELENHQEAMFSKRLTDAQRITGNINNSVTLIVSHMADLDSYSSTLANLLRGSSIRQSTIDAIVQTTLPRQLLQAVELEDVSALAGITGLANDRLERVFERLRDSDSLAELSRVILMDTVDLRLIDGSVEKSVENLSTGQKCAVTLPIILSEQSKSLLLDQPEDHLDNEFLVDNVVSILRARSAKNLQTIVATHNANIPVLGEADNVISLVSSGKSASVGDVGPFDADDIVSKVTSLMEGGRDAFKRRAAFYAKHGSLDA